MATLTIIERRDPFVRWRLDYEDGSSRFGFGDYPDEIEQAKAEGTSLAALIARTVDEPAVKVSEEIAHVTLRPAVTEQISDVEVEAGAVRYVMPEHEHRDYARRQDIPVGLSEQQAATAEVARQTAAKLDATVHHTEQTANVLRQLGDQFRVHGHDDYAEKAHAHPHLQEAIVSAESSTTRLGITVQRVNEALQEHAQSPHLGEHGHQGYAVEHHDHQEIRQAIEDVRLMLSALSERVAALEAKPDYVLEEHGHDQYALLTHPHPELELIPDGQTRRKDVGAHEHHYDTRRAGEPRWLCGTCFAPKPE